MTTIRTATSQDRDAIRRIYASAFPSGESNAVARLAVDLLAETTTPDIVSLLAEADGSVVGHVAFSPVVIDNGHKCSGYILAPLAVNPEYQRRRIGSKLIEHGMARMSAKGVDVVFVYGDPEYYERFGFSADAAERYIAPYKLQYPFGWQAFILNEWDLGKGSVPVTCVAALCNPGLW
jgi:putative acetyltransferase